MKVRLLNCLKCCEKAKGTFVCGYSTSKYDNPVYLDIFRGDEETFNVYYNFPNEAKNWKKKNISLSELIDLVDTWEDRI